MITILHFGAQYAQLIRRAVNELGVRTKVISPRDVQRERPPDITGVILSGSPASVNDDALACARTILAWRLPVLGICFGHQVLVTASGGTVVSHASREYGKAVLQLQQPLSPLFAEIPSNSTVWMSHGDTVVALPSGPWRTIGKTDRGEYAAIAHEEDQLFGVQFHPEVSHTEYGTIILRNFLRSICRAPQDFSPADLAQEMTRSVQESVGDTAHVMVACSLGVDSTTTALLCTRALGEDRVHPFFVENGLQRDEDLALASRAREFLPNLRVVDAAERFLCALENVADPEEKRKIVGRTFWAVFQDLARELQARVPLGVYSQGTLAPDIIESGAESGSAAVIKTHHNLVAPPPDFPFCPFEPLRTLYKDEVRALGSEIGVPEEILTRHPFPGPGLAIRVLGLVTRDRVRAARACDTIFTTMLKKYGHYDRISQALVGLGNDRMVGVRGDQRAYGWAVHLRAVTTRDFMTADVASFPPGFIPDVADRIVNQVPEVAHVTLSEMRKPPGTIEFE